MRGWCNKRLTCPNVKPRQRAALASIALGHRNKSDNDPNILKRRLVWAGRLSL